MFQKQKNTLAMQLAGLGVVFWLLLLYPASTAETGVLRWHPQMHWFDKLAWYTFMAVGPALAGFLFGVGFGERRVYRICERCRGKFDVEAMLWGFDDDTGQVGSWRCKRCCEEGKGTKEAP